MKANPFINRILSVMMTTAGLLSCSKEEVQPIRQQPGPVSVQFKFSTLAIQERSSPVQVVLAFNQAAQQNGSITLSVSADHYHDFKTSPGLIDGTIVIPVSAGQTEASFLFEPINNESLTGPQLISVVIASVTDGLLTGSVKELSITLQDDELPAQVAFLQDKSSVSEDAEQGFMVVIPFSQAAPGTGSIEISITSDLAVYGVHYTTDPAASNGKVELSVEPGMHQARLQVLPVNDFLFNQDRVIQFSIEKVSGALEKGSQLVNELRIVDEEKTGLRKSYETVSNGWRVKRTYSYDEQGNIHQIQWEQNTLRGTYTYHYNAGRLVTKITSSDLTETHFTRDIASRIIKSETYKQGELKKYELFGYDDAGNVGEVAVFDRQPSGEFIMTRLFVYLYYVNGNLYKRLSFSPEAGSEEYNLLSEEIYGNYMDRDNQFPMVELLPGRTTQIGLPTSYQLNQNGLELNYSFEYEYNSMGSPSMRRTIKNGQVVELTSYSYY
ncbi:MAG: hypothetical protein MUE95_13695 [Cyclobacteriaceae bacterium]|jgi:hypothetical protein|nr:hypothetical protein [Cyclobacteriaceae bacterium]